jgi:hypothetical protein
VENNAGPAAQRARIPAKDLEETIVAIDLPRPVQAIIDAANAGDTGTFLACFTADGAVDDWGRVFHGRIAIEKWSTAEFIGVSVTLRVTAANDTGSETVVTAQVGGDGFNGPSHFSFRLVEGLVSRMTIRG